ncbi:hypothetical protein QQF64_011493 [Cirrhinus molitorella]|uniref:Uncharacterized protein n=1 Tax=Cirrhinus molitorella TaxID=172907 RepID=A0ABR3M2G7_9TELE
MTEEPDGALYTLYKCYTLWDYCPNTYTFFGQVLEELLPPSSLLPGVSTHPLPAKSRSKCQRGPTWEKPTLWHLTGQRQCHARPEALTPDENTMACSLPADAGRAGRYGPRFLLLADTTGRRLSDSSSSPGTSGHPYSCARTPSFARRGECSLHSPIRDKAMLAKRLECVLQMAVSL